MKNVVYCVIPNLNEKALLGLAIESLQKQSQPVQIIVVENGSTDGSKEFVEEHYPGVILLPFPKNLGFAGGVNQGIKYAIEHYANYVALFNNDAVAHKDWLRHLLESLEKHPNAGIATGKFASIDKKHLDSTGDMYTSWGLPFPRGRGEPVSDKYDQDNWVFAASGGASLYRVNMLQQIGLFDEDFFAYYEDVDISFRAQLAGWKVYYEPAALAHHDTGSTSSKIKGFTTYQSLKNLPFLLWKNVPGSLLPTVLPRFTLIYLAFVFRALGRGQISAILKALLVTTILFPKKLWQRHTIKSHRKVSVDYIRSILVWDLPPNARKLRRLRVFRRKAA